jgi:peptide deformylase
VPERSLLRRELVRGVMALLSIRTYGDPVLRKRAHEVTDIDQMIVRLSQNMIETVRNAGGIGLAATQVGELPSLFVIDPTPLGMEEKPFVVINPRIVEVAGELRREEGCLSIPGLSQELVRPARVVIRGIDLDGKEITLEATSILARAFLHEIDHLNGVLFIDHLKPGQRELLRGKLREIARKKE